MERHPIQPRSVYILLSATIQRVKPSSSMAILYKRKWSSLLDDIIGFLKCATLWCTAIVNHRFSQSRYKNLVDP